MTHSNNNADDLPFGADFEHGSLGQDQTLPGGAAEPEPFAVLEALHIENRQLKDEAAGLKDKALRALADIENLRRRAEKEAADAKAYAVTRFAGDMLPVADNLRRALEAIPEEARESADGAFKTFIEGIELTERDLYSHLARHGVKKLEPMDSKFDPNFHQAIFEIPDASVPNGTVRQVMQTGFSIGERVLRPAMVGVSKGGSKAAAAEGSTSARGDAAAQDDGG
jgi:molecular chaperone GrpE